MPQKDLSKKVKDCAHPVHTVLHIDQTIEEALTSLRRRKIDEKIIYFYVIDDEGRLEGIVPTRQLLLKERHCTIKEIMVHPVFRIREDQTLEEGMELLSTHQLLQMPVVDGKQKLIGVIDVQMYLDGSFDIANARHSSDVFQILGLTLEMGKRRAPGRATGSGCPGFCATWRGGLRVRRSLPFSGGAEPKSSLSGDVYPSDPDIERIDLDAIDDAELSPCSPERQCTPRRLLHRILSEGKMVILARYDLRGCRWLHLFAYGEEGLRLQ